MALINRDQIEQSKRNARLAKASGAGSTATSGKTSSANLGLKDAIIGGITGLITGGPAGAVAGAAAGLAKPAPTQKSSSAPALPNMTDFGRQTLAASSPCKLPAIRVGSQCIDPTAALPGGRPFVSTAGGAAVMGAFGMPAMQPMAEQRRVLHCGPGMVLGKDNLCYPKALLSRRSKWRKWRQPPRPPVTSADVAAIRRAARARDRVAQLATDVGFAKPKRRK